MINVLLKDMMLENVTSIDAPQSVVWNVTIDIERWPQWTPTVTSVKRLGQGPFDRGSAALIKQPGLPDAKWIVTSLTPGEQFTWESRVRGIRMIATHELSTREGATESALRIRMSGVVARLLWPLICSSVRRSLEQENQGLKAKCKTSVP
jgi:uncharacterized membrane protein